MKGLLLAGSLVGSVLASSHGRHMGFHNRRGDTALSTGTGDEVCAVVTVYTTYYYGEPTLVQQPTAYSTPTPSSSTEECSSSSTSSTPSSTSTPTPTPTPSTTQQPATPSSYAAPSSSSSSADIVAAAYGGASSVAAEFYAQPSSASSSNGGSYSGGKVSSNGQKWAITYTPYDDAGHCKSADQVMSDLKSIASKGFKAVRTYSTDCSALPNIGAAAEATGLQLILGVYISKSGVSGAQSQVNDIVKWAKWNLVQMIVVGNEAVFNKFCSASDLAGFIGSAKSSFRGAGFTGPVTTTEPVNIIQEIGSQLCGVIDVVGANIHAYFNAATSASEAGDFVVQELALLKTICPGKDTYNLETGWPTSGNTNGAAVPGYSQQKTALESIMNKAGDKSVMFSFGNDYWKDKGAYGVEQAFGCLNIF